MVEISPQQIGALKNAVVAAGATEYWGSPKKVDTVNLLPW